MARTLINVPKTAEAGEVVTIKTLISHPMETGFRPGADGRIMARDIITEFTCLYDGEEVFRAELFPATAANPYLTFTLVAERSGTLTFTWRGDNGFDADRDRDADGDVRPSSLHHVGSRALDGLPSPLWGRGRGVGAVPLASAAGLPSHPHLQLLPTSGRRDAKAVPTCSRQLSFEEACPRRFRPAGRDHRHGVRDPPGRAALGLRRDEPRDQGDAGRRHRQSGPALACRTAPNSGPRPRRPGQPACAGCHGEAAASMRGVAARYPAFDEGRGGADRPAGPDQRSAAASARAPSPFAYESRELLGAVRLRRGPVARPCRSRRRTIRASPRPAAAARRCSRAHGPARPLLRRLPRRQSRAAASARP